MTSRPGNRVPLRIPELHGYSVDSEGQVWRIGGTRTGRDRPLKGMGFTDAIRAWEARASLDGLRVLLAMPGVWKFCNESTPSATACRLNRHGDAVGFMMYHLNARDPEYSEAIARAFNRDGDCRAWFVIRTEASSHAPLLVAGPIAFAALCRNPPESPLPSK